MKEYPDLSFVGWIGFIPKEKYEKEGEMWEYQTTTDGPDKDGKFVITMHLLKPIRKIHSTHNAHP